MYPIRPPFAACICALFVQPSVFQTRRLVLRANHDASRSHWSAHASLPVQGRHWYLLLAPTL